MHVHAAETFTIGHLRLSLRYLYRRMCFVSGIA